MRVLCPRPKQIVGMKQLQPVVSMRASHEHPPTIGVPKQCRVRHPGASDQGVEIPPASWKFAGLIQANFTGFVTLRHHVPIALPAEHGRVGQMKRFIQHDLVVLPTGARIVTDRKPDVSLPSTLVPYLDKHIPAIIVLNHKWVRDKQGWRIRNVRGRQHGIIFGSSGNQGKRRGSFVHGN